MAATADSVVVELVAKTEGYTAAIRGAGTATDAAMGQVERAATKGEGAVLRFSQQSTRSAAQAANATRNLGRQVADIGVGISSGQSPFLILAQQAPQVADALADTGGKAAQVAAFFAGPWGAALLAAGSALGVLLGKALETGGGVEELVAKLEAQASRAALSAEADRIFAGTQAGLAARVRDTTNALATQNATLRTNAQLRNVQAQSENIAAQARVAQANTAVEAARRNVQRTLGQGGTRGEVGTERAIAQAREANAALEAAQATAREANANLNVSRVFLARESALANSTEQGRITKQYDDQINALSRRALAEARAGKLIGTATRDRIEALEKEKAAALEAASARERVTGGGRTRTGGGRSAVRSRAMSSTATEPFVFSAAYVNDDGAFNRLIEDAKRAGERAAQAFRDVFGKDETIDAGVKDYERERDARLAAAAEAEDRAQDIREANIRSLANTFEDLFVGGTNQVWANFKREGLRTLAILLARAAIQNFSKGGGGTSGFFQSLGEGLKSAFGGGGTPGRASGGYVAPNSTVRVNEGRTSGVELLRMGPQGGTVIPLGQTRAAQRGGSTTVVQYISVDGRNSVTPAGFAASILDEADRRAGAVIAGNNGVIRRSLPGAQARFEQLGTTG